MTSSNRESPASSISVNRRAALVGAASAVLAMPSIAEAQSSPQAAEETKLLDQLYDEAVAAGGNLVIYAGGDVQSQADGVRQAFLQRFPKMKPTFVVDYSKFHDVRLDNQFATDSVVPDVIQIQTVQNFARWKRDGRLLNYKPAGFSGVYDRIKDPDGAWLAIAIIGFSYMYEAGLEQEPKTPRDLVDPKWLGKIQSSYPQDDDAVLYLFKLYAEAYGWDWMAKLAAQNLQFARGSHTPALAVNGRQKPIGLGGSGSLLAPPTVVARWTIADGHPFMAWGQRAAILKAAKNTAAAKLYMNWSISTDRQQAAFNGWSVRTDVKPNGGLKPIWQYPNGNVDGFPAFMADRGLVERWRQTMVLYFGEVKGDPSPGWRGLFPGR